MDVAVFNESQKVINPPVPLYLKVETVEHALIVNARRNFADFYFYMTGMHLARHQLEWTKAVLAEESSKTNIIAPRESGKTSCFNMLMAYFMGKRPYTSNIIVCASHEQAKERLGDILDIVEGQRFMNVFPTVKLDPKRPNTASTFSLWSSKWKNEEKVLSYNDWRTKVRSDKALSPKDYTLRAAGITSSAIPGKRFSGLVVADDLHDEKNSRTEEQRLKVEMLFKKTLIGCMTIKARIVLICTRWAETDLSGRLKADKRIDGTPVWHTIEHTAIYQDEEGVAYSYWPEKWPLEDLMERREVVGNIVFELMYMNNPLGLATGEITMEMCQNAIDWDEFDPAEFDEFLITVDIAQSLTDRADYTVFTLQGRKKVERTKEKKYPQFEVWVFNIWRDKVKMNDCIDKLYRFHSDAIDMTGRVHAVLFEKQGFQGAWADALKDRDPSIEVKQVSLKGDKEQRFIGMTPKWQSNKYKVNTKMKNYHMMCSELIAFPTSQHDDIVDTLSMPYSYWGITTSKNVGSIKVKSRHLK